MERPLRVLVCSGNMGNAMPDEESMAAWLPKDGCYSEVVNNPHYPLPPPEERDELLKELKLDPIAEGVKFDGGFSDDSEDEDDYFDIIVIGMQEATFEVEDEKGDIKVELLPIVEPLLNKATRKIEKTGKRGVATVTTLAGSTDHTTQTKNKMFNWIQAKDTKILQQLMADRCPSYDFAIRFQRGEMRLEILVRRDLEVKVLSVRAQNTGLVNLAANKGGIVGELLVGGTTRLSFVTAHLEAHEGNVKYQHRCQMLTDILDGTADESISGVKYDMSLKSHYCFVLGDLNFRTEIDPDLPKEEHRELVMKMVEAQQYKELNKVDELFRALRQKDMAVNFQTLPCFFPPTFKVERGDGYSYNEKRRPSYTDRILWKCGDKLEGRLTPTAYEAIEKFVASDHKPIRGAFEIELNQPVRLREPRLEKRAGGMFQRMSMMVVHKEAPPPPQSLHIFISNIKCRIHERKETSESTLKPDPFVAFLSCPKELVQPEKTKWQKFKQFTRAVAGKDLMSKTNKDGTIMRTAHGWPRTRKLIGTLEPDWSNDDAVHMKVKSHDDLGNALDHTGSILFFSLFDASGIDISLIGTFPLNLASLCASANSTQRSLLGGRGSVYLKSGSMADALSTIVIDEPLLKYGRERGWISCDIGASWMDDPAAERKHHHHHHH